MNQNRLQDQVLIMGAIKVVKQELKTCNPDNFLESGEIVVRLMTLYSLLDIDKLMAITLKADTRDKEAA
jgi:hypothetical protein